ncbi:glutaredoxin family protein [Microbacterium hydrocarbonoxydans]|uniref:glutaredoxin family protein n=1 Tax=Microbacterium hydrocarbonoxydans TaxID=273678 RepID=UPI003D95F290
MTVTVYTKENCQPCKATMRYLDERGIVFDEFDVADPESLAAAKALGYSGAPVVVFTPGHGESADHWYGFRPDKLDAVVATLEGVHPLLGKVVRWTHGPNVLVGPATHYNEDDDELFIVPEGLIYGHYWVPAAACEREAA